MNNITMAVLSNSFLFRKMNEASILSCLELVKPNFKRYSKGEIIFSPSHYNRSIGIIISGKCEIKKERSSGADIPLNNLEAGDSFGILAALSERESFPTTIIATKACEILYITQEDLKILLKACPEISLNVIYFLTNRISFLNDKIDDFSADNTEQKLVNHILHLYKKESSKSIKFNKKRCAEMLNIGRASLYRSISHLEELGLIKCEEKLLLIIDPEGLERISK